MRPSPHLRCVYTPDHSPLPLPDDPHQALGFHCTDDLFELTRVYANATLVRELLHRVGPADTARSGGGRRGGTEKGEHLLLHVLAELALLLPGAGIEQAHVDLARRRVERGRADGVAHEAVGLLHVAQLHVRRKTHARVRLGETDHRLELARRRRYAFLGRCCGARVVSDAAQLDVRLD